MISNKTINNLEQYFKNDMVPPQFNYNKSTGKEYNIDWKMLDYNKQEKSLSNLDIFLNNLFDSLDLKDLKK
jgi:hypothetical protein